MLPSAATQQQVGAEPSAPAEISQQVAQQHRGSGPSHSAAPPAAPAPGSPEWRAALPPELQQALEESGLAEALDEHAAALREDQEWARDEQFGGGDMEAVSRILEDGGDLPPMPDDQWLCEPEDPDVFMARLQGSIDYTNANLKGSKHAPREEGDGPEAAAARAAAEAAAAVHTSDRVVLAAALRYSLEPRLAAAYARGWEMGKAVDRMWDSGELRKAPIMPEEVTRSIPAPALPPHIERVYKGAERIAYVLRRAHLESDAPDAALLMLQSKGLVSEELVLQDPFVHRGSLDTALRYLQRLRLAGATMQLSTLLLQCHEYDPLPKFKVNIDCFIDFPYPDWFYGWAVLNPDARFAPATSAAASPLSTVSAAAVEAKRVEQAAAADREEEEDAALMQSMLWSAQRAAADAGRQLDAQGTAAVLRAAARICLDRRQRQQEAEQEAAREARIAAKEATQRAAARTDEEQAAAEAAAEAGQLPPPELLAVHSQPYQHEGQRRQHTWVMMDWDERHRQLGRQQFAAFPRHPGGSDSGDAAGQGEQAAPGTAGVSRQQGVASEEELEAEQRRQYAQLPTDDLLEWHWARAEWLAARYGDELVQQDVPQDVQQPAAGGAQHQQGQQGQQEGSAIQDGDDTSGGGSGKKKKKRRQKGKAGGGGGGPQWWPAAEDEELFPFTFDWERQSKRREAGQILRMLLGQNFDKAMGQLPQLGRTRGRTSNAALQQRADQEGTAWLSGECMTVQVTFTYTVDPRTLQVDTCGLVWGGVHGLELREVTDAWDIWLEATGLMHDAECAQDEELLEEMEAAAGGWGNEQAAWLAEWRRQCEQEGEERPCSWVPLWRL